MRRLKKEKVVFEGGVINEMTMLAYLNDELNTEEKQQFEKLLQMGRNGGMKGTR